MSIENITEKNKILMRLKTVVENLRLTKTEIALKTGYSKGQVGWILEGKTNITGKFIRIFCNEYNISEEWLAKGTGLPTEEEIFGDGEKQITARLPLAEQRQIEKIVGAELSPLALVVAEAFDKYRVSADPAENMDMASQTLKFLKDYKKSPN